MDSSRTRKRKNTVLSTSETDENLNELTPKRSKIDLSDSPYTPSHPIETKSRLTKKSKKNRLFSNPTLLASLDRDKISCRIATRIIAATATALGENVDEITFSTATLKRKRTEIRGKLNKFVKETFNFPSRLVVHFDGKLLLDNSGSFGERLAVMVSGNSKDCQQGKLLSARQIEDSSGENQSDEIMLTLNEWNILEKVSCMCFDTTSSNTGWIRGAAVKLEQKIGKALLWFPCRHHIHEIYIKAAFESIYGEDNSPDYAFFQQFARSWHLIDEDNYDSLEIQDENDRLQQNEIIQFCLNQLENFQPRDDYREALELVLITLGHKTQKFSFKRPGACHKARWLAVVIYCLKINLFRVQLGIPPEDCLQLERLIRFICLIYIQHWYLSPTARNAPHMDLLLHKKMVSYLNVDREIANAVLDKLKRHTWYLNMEYAPFSLFSEFVSDDEKLEIATALNNVRPPAQYKGGYPSEVKLSIRPHIARNYKLSSFVKPGSHFIFDTMNFDKSRLSLPVNDWKNHEGFKEIESFVRNILVVNDTAERGIKLISDYANCLTKNASERQEILQLVEYHRSTL